MNTKQEKMYYALLDLTTEEVVDVLLNWHGEQILDEGFYKYLVDEGVLEEEEEEEQ